MRIQVRDEDRDFCLELPTNLIFSRFVLRLVLKHSDFGKAMEGLPPDAADRLLAELKRIRKQRGSWELVEVHSADGQHVTITL